MASLAVKGLTGYNNLPQLHLDYGMHSMLGCFGNNQVFKTR